MMDTEEGRVLVRGFPYADYVVVSFDYLALTRQF